MTRNCAQIEDRLGEYVDRLLPAAERAEFEAHTAQCPLCSGLLRQVRGCVAQMHQMEMLEAPAGLAPAILDATLGPRAQKAAFWRVWLGSLQLVWQPRFALGLAAAVLSMALVLPALDMDPRNLSMSDLHPANMYRAADRRIHILYVRGAKFINDLRVVYEIQSRFGGSRPATPPEGEPNPPQQRPGDPRRERNRADEIQLDSMILASVSSSQTERSY